MLQAAVSARAIKSKGAANMSKINSYNACIYARLSRDDGDKLESDSIINCKSQYKNAGFGQNKNVGFPTFLFCLSNHHQSLAEADLLICRKDH